jgi:hypothetical protein
MARSIAGCAGFLTLITRGSARSDRVPHHAEDFLAVALSRNAKFSRQMQPLYPKAYLLTMVAGSYPLSLLLQIPTMSSASPAEHSRIFATQRSPNCMLTPRPFSARPTN